MTKNLFLDFLREIKKSFNRFLSILLIVAIGTAFFVGLRASSPDMKYTVDNHYDNHKVFDIQVVSSFGITKENVEDLSKMDIVERVQPGFFTDALTTVGGTEYIFRIHSLPQSYLDGESDCINEVDVVEGRLPQAPGEIVIEKGLNLNSGLEIGDTVTFVSGDDEEDITEETLDMDTFTVVGKITTPYYFTYNKGVSQINGRSIQFFCYISENDFNYPEDVYTEATILINGARELNTFDKAYENLITNAKNQISNAGVDLSRDRTDEIREEAQETVDDYQKEYDDALADYNKEVADAQQELDDAYTELIQAEEQLKSEREKYDIQVENAEDQIADGWEQLKNGESNIKTLEDALSEGQKQYDNAKDEYDKAMKQYNRYGYLLDDVEDNINTLQDILDSMEPNELNAPVRAMIQSVIDSYQEIVDEVGSLQEGADDLIESVEEGLDTASDTLSSARKRLNEAKQEYNDGLTKVRDAEKELADKKADAQVEFDDAEKEIADGWEEYYDGLEEFAEKKQEGQDELDEAAEKLQDARYEIERIENASWYVLGRTENYGYVSYQSTINRMAAIGNILPIFFILVAVLVCVTTMTRMISDERTVIGTYKALGYSDMAIASKYTIYVIAASLIGVILGSVLGELLFPRAVYNAWAAMYTQPAYMQKIRVGTIILAFVVIIAAMAGTALNTCRNELITEPSQLMRPKAPKAGKTILLEKIGFIWKRLSFSNKVTARNLFRYKKRLFMTIIGIMGCTALLLTGFGMNDTISRVAENQYGGIFKYNISVSLSDSIEEDEETALLQHLDESETIASYCRTGMTTLTISNETNSETMSTFVIEDIDRFRQFVDIRDYKNGEALEITDDGIVLTQKLAQELEVTIGDVVDVMDNNDMTKKMTVTGIAENYVYHYAYLSQTCYQDYFWKEIGQNALLLTVADGCSTEMQDDEAERLTTYDGVSSVQNYAEYAKDVSKLIASMNTIIVLIIVCAALLAFVVLYNLTNINISERMREIATIKVLGFKNLESAMYVYRENALLTVMGGVVGLVAGIGLHRVIIKAIEQSNIMFGYVISPLSYLLSFLLTCVFSALVLLYMYPKLNNIHMVESLKTVE